MDCLVRRFEFPADKFICLGDRNNLFHACSGLDSRDVTFLDCLHNADNRAVSAARRVRRMSQCFQYFDYATDFRYAGVRFHYDDHDSPVGPKGPALMLFLRRADSSTNP